MCGISVYLTLYTLRIAGDIGEMSIERKEFKTVMELDVGNCVRPFFNFNYSVLFVCADNDRWFVDDADAARWGSGYY